MCSVRRIRDPAGQLFHGEQFGIQSENVILRTLWQRQEAESHRRIVAKLFFAPLKVNRPFINPTGRACLESSYLESQVTKRLAKTGTGIRHSPAGPRVLTHVKQPAQKSSRRDYNGVRTERHPDVGCDTGGSRIPIG